MSFNNYFSVYYNDYINGNKFKRKKGEKVFVAEKLWVDDSLLRHYNFVRNYIRMRSVDKGYTVLVGEYDFTYHWEQVND
jgi:hypothetical protein